MKLLLILLSLTYYTTIYSKPQWAGEWNITSTWGGEMNPFCCYPANPIIVEDFDWYVSFFFGWNETFGSCVEDGLTGTVKVSGVLQSVSKYFTYLEVDNFGTVLVQIGGPGILPDS